MSNVWIIQTLDRLVSSLALLQLAEQPELDQALGVGVDRRLGAMHPCRDLVERAARGGAKGVEHRLVDRAQGLGRLGPGASLFARSDDLDRADVAVRSAQQPQLAEGVTVIFHRRGAAAEPARDLGQAAVRPLSIGVEHGLPPGA